MDKKRVFVAIDISEAARVSVTEHIAKLREVHPEKRVRWVSPENLHVTLRFVGNVDAEDLKDLDGRVESIAARSREFEMTLAETGNFGRRRDRTDTLWIASKQRTTLLTGSLLLLRRFGPKSSSRISLSLASRRPATPDR
jgi:2'-5' RNA ligase